MDAINYRNNLSFNPNPSTVMHLDLNSCFATIEQQANPFLRGKPIAVAAYSTPSGCIIAPSVEAKRLGIKVGMRVKDGKLICPGLTILEPDPWKYRNVHLKLKRLLESYSNDVTPKSIDEFVLDFKDIPLKTRSLKPVVQYNENGNKVGLSPIKQIALEIKQKIKNEIGEWITVSVGIGPNRFLAKLGAGLHKPDGLDEINGSNFKDVYGSLELTGLCGIKLKNCIRLGSLGIYSVLDFAGADVATLKAAFGSIAGYYWYLRLRGWEIDDVEFGRHSYGNSYALPKPAAKFSEVLPILAKLVEKMSFRLRRAGFMARGVHLAIWYRGGGFWHKGTVFNEHLFDSRDIYRKIVGMLYASPCGNRISNLAVSTFDLKKKGYLQLDIFQDLKRKRQLIEALDGINERWGSFVITPANMAAASKAVPDRIAFGGVKELEEFTIQDTNIRMSANDTNGYE